MQNSGQKLLQDFCENPLRYWKRKYHLCAIKARGKHLFKKKIVIFSSNLEIWLNYYKTIPIKTSAMGISPWLASALPAWGAGSSSALQMCYEPPFADDCL